jgi:biopolymer transport protein ExbD
MLLKGHDSKTVNSPLLQGSILKPSKKRNKKSLATALVLTSLVDAFTIILLYLLVAGTGTPSQLQLNADEKNLPIATQATPIDAGTIIKIENGKYFVEGKETALSQIAEVLRQIRMNFKPSDLQPQASLVIQANKKADISQLTPIIRAGSISGFNQFKFAVIHEEG